MSAFVSRIPAALDEIREEMKPVAEGMAAETEDEIRKTMMGGSPSGERYPDPEVGFYRASAPGEPPAVRTGDYLRSYGHTEAVTRGRIVVAAVTSDERTPGGSPLWILLTYGTVNMAPRPHVLPGAEAAAAEVRSAARASAQRGAGRPGALKQLTAA